MSENTTKQVKEGFFNSLENSIMDIDGGYIKSEVWFCGIEPGGAISTDYVNEYQAKKHTVAVNKILMNEDLLESHNIKNLMIPLFLDNIYETPKWVLDNYIAKIVSVFNNNNSKHFNYDKNEDNVFKLNLFPLPAKDVDYWNKTHEEITGCTLKKEYYGKCIEKRFPMLRRLTEAANPKVVVCIGKTFINEFILAFWGNSNWWNEKGEQKMPEGIPYTDSNKSITVNVYSGDEGKPTLIVTPFFGWRYHCVNVNNPENAIFIGNLVSEVLKSRL